MGYSEWIFTIEIQLCLRLQSRQVREKFLEFFSALMTPLLSFFFAVKEAMEAVVQQSLATRMQISSRKLQYLCWLIHMVKIILV